MCTNMSIVKFRLQSCSREAKLQPFCVAFYTGVANFSYFMVLNQRSHKATVYFTSSKGMLRNYM